MWKIKAFQPLIRLSKIMEEHFSNYSKIKERMTTQQVGKNVSTDAPKVSVIIPAYNIAPFIKETLDSVFAQTYKNFETILVNDGSPDTAELETALAPYFDKIIYIEQKNSGAAAARNLAIAASHGTILAFLDGDDVWFPEYLSSQINFLETHDYEMVYCDAEFFGEKYYKHKTYMQQSRSEGKVTPASLLKTDCNVITSGTIVLKNALTKYGLFDLDALRVEDFEMWFRLSKHNVKIAYQKEVLLKYRIRLGSLTGNNVERAERTIKALEIIKEKNELTETELNIWHDRMKISWAELYLEKGKSYLAESKFAEARASFQAANKQYRKFKLTVINWLLVVNPKLALKLFRKIRSSEFFLIAPNNSKH